MRKSLHIIILFVLAYAIKSASAQEMFQKTISIVNGGYSVGETIVENDDGTFFISGYAQRAIAPQSNFDFFLVKMDSTGNILWGKTYGGQNAEVIGEMKKLSNGSLLIAGGSKSYIDTVDRDMYVINVDTGGNLIWSKTFYDSNFGVIIDIEQGKNGDIILVGAINNLFGADSANAVLVCLDIDGSTKWIKEYDIGYNEIFCEIVSTEDFGFNITGHISSDIILFDDVFVMKIDSSGNQVWGKVYGSPDSVRLLNSGIHMLVDQDDNVLISAFTKDYGTQIGRDFLLLKHDANGNLLWANRYGGLLPGDHEVHEMLVALDGNYLVDWTNTLNLVNSSDGSMIWSKNYSVIPGFPRSLIIKKDKGIASTGYASNGPTAGLVTYFNVDSIGNQCFTGNFNLPYASVTVGNANISFQVNSITLTEDTGCTVTSINPTDSTYCFTATSVGAISEEYNKIKVYPNPANELLYIDVSNLLQLEGTSVQIFDITGKLIFEEEINANEKNTQLNISGFSQGLYILSVTTTTEKQVSKFLKL